MTTMLTIAAMEVQADYIFNELLMTVSISRDDANFVAAHSPLYTGTDPVGYFLV